MFEVFLSQKHHQLWTFRPSQPVISKDLVTSFSRKKRKKIEKSMIFGCFLTFLASIIIVESLKTIKHPKTVWIWRKNHFSNYFDKKNVPIKKTVTDAFFLSPDSWNVGGGVLTHNFWGFSYKRGGVSRWSFWFLRSIRSLSPTNFTFFRWFWAILDQKLHVISGKISLDCFILSRQIKISFFRPPELKFRKKWSRIDVN